MELQRVGQNWSNLAHTLSYVHLILSSFFLKIKAKLPSIFRYFTHAHTMALPKNSLFFWLRNVSSIMSLITAFLFFFMDLFQEQDLFHLLSPTSHLFFLITILVLALSSPLWSKSEVKVKVAQSGLTLYDPMDYTVLGILQARIGEWVAYPFSSGASWPRNWTGVPTLIILFFKFIFVYFFLAAPCSMRDLSSPARDQTCAPCSGSSDS